MSNNSDAPLKPWGIFTNSKNVEEVKHAKVKLPDPPPWRRFEENATSPYSPPTMPAKQHDRGRVFRLPRANGEALTQGHLEKCG